MNKKSKITLAACASVLLFSSANAGELSVELGGIQNKLSTNFVYGNATNNTNISGSDVGLKKRDTSIKPTIAYKKNAHNVNFDYEKIDFSGSKVLNKTVVFNNKTYNLGERVSSTMKFDWYRLGYDYSFNENFYAGLDMHLVKSDIGLKTNNQSEEYSKTIPIPALVLGGNIGLNERFGLEAKASGMKVGSKASYVNFYGGTNMKCFLTENGSWKLGYQYKKLDLDANKLDGDIKLKGIYLGFNYRF